ncbi:MAG TPA: hypothetical protein PKV48_03615, partial [Thermodesulfobacteriota bacterium]|nr:hypothetical protein [Thermodesulfobacteriota bacterium]
FLNVLAFFQKKICAELKRPSKYNWIFIEIGLTNHSRGWLTATADFYLRRRCFGCDLKNCT